MSVHTTAQTGFSNEAATYARGRPSYPSQIEQWLAGDLGIAAGTVVVDLGAGTGKFTRLLFRSGAEVIAAAPADSVGD